MDQIHLSPLVDQIQLALGHISNNCQLHTLRAVAAGNADYDDVLVDGVESACHPRL
jgi:hypothetical protein